MEYKIISILYSASLFRQFNLIVNAHKQGIQNITHIQKHRIIMLCFGEKRLRVDENGRREGQEGEEFPD